MSSLLIQVAGIIDAAEADCVIAAGATHLGFPLRLPDGREDLTEAEAARVVAHVGDRAACVLITYQVEAAEIVAFARELGVTGVQLHGNISADEVAVLRGLAPDLFLIQSLVIGAEPEAALSAFARSVEPSVDAFITDTWDPTTGRRGATGLVHDWHRTRALVEALDRPVIVAGGLTADNVAEAMLATGAAGVDAHTGLEGPDGRKDGSAVLRFVEQATRAWSSHA